MTFNSVQDTADDSDNYQLNGLSYRQCQREWSSFVFDPSWCSFSEWSHLVPRTVRRTVFEKLISALLKRIEGHSHQCYDRRLTRPKMVARTQISAPNLERNCIFFFTFSDRDVCFWIPNQLAAYIRNWTQHKYHFLINIK